MVHGTYNELVTGAFVNQRSHHVWGPHIARWCPTWVQLRMDTKKKLTGLQSRQCSLWHWRHLDKFHTSKVGRKMPALVSCFRCHVFPFFWGGTSSIVFILLKDPPLKPTCFSLRRVAIVELWVCVSFFSVAWQDMQDIGSSHGSWLPWTIAW